jgi:hypothetical protein
MSFEQSEFFFSLSFLNPLGEEHFQRATALTFYSGLQWNKMLKQDLHLRLMYNFSRLTQDLGLGSSIESESENEYYSESSDYLYESGGYSNMFDDRSGHGDRTISNHTIQSALNWQVVNEHTHEYYRLTEEDKTINWEFRSRLRSLQIPVMYQYDINPRFDLLVGINRTMNFWKIENTTLVLYDYRRRVENDEILIETMTGERISEPDERISATNTNFLVGITFSPVSDISVQFLASPGIEDHSLVDEKNPRLPVLAQCEVPALILAGASINAWYEQKETGFYAVVYTK